MRPQAHGLRAAFAAGRCAQPDNQYARQMVPIRVIGCRPRCFQRPARGAGGAGTDARDRNLSMAPRTANAALAQKPCSWSCADAVGGLPSRPAGAGRGC